MAEKSLHAQRIELLREAEEISRITEPLNRRRDMLLRKAAAIEVVLEPLEARPGDLIEAGFTAARLPAIDPSPRYTIHVDAGGRVSVSEPPAVYRPSVAKESSVDASVLIGEILGQARRPLHRLEIFMRGRVHPLGPLNYSTMSTVLSREPMFERLKRRALGRIPAGYWLMHDWPDGWKAADRVQPAGRVYSEALVTLDRQRSHLRRLHHERGVMERRLAELRIRAPEGDAEVERVARLERFLERHIARLDFDTRRARVQVNASWQATSAARDALGEDADKYPPVPPIDQVADRTADHALDVDDLDGDDDELEGDEA
jgi:hypothetical protein